MIGCKAINFDIKYYCWSGFFISKKDFTITSQFISNLFLRQYRLCKHIFWDSKKGNQYFVYKMSSSFWNFFRVPQVFFFCCIVVWWRLMNLSQFLKNFFFLVNHLGTKTGCESCIFHFGGQKHFLTLFNS